MKPLFTFALAASVIAMLFATPPTALASPVTIKGDGSTFAYPMYDKWIGEYTKENPGVLITYQSNGSGAGIHDIMLGTVDFAGTDGPLTNTQMLDFSAHRNCEVLHTSPPRWAQTSPFTTSPAFSR